MQINRLSHNWLRYFSLKLQAGILLALGYHSGALAVFDKMVSAWPLNRYALASRGHVLVQLNQAELAIVCQQQLVEFPGLPTQKAAALFNLGYLLQQAGRQDEARASFEKALEFNACMDQAWYGLALVLIHQQKYHEAREALQKNTALQPMSPYGWYQLAQVNLAMGQTEEARKVVDHLRQFEPRVAAQLEREIRREVSSTVQTEQVSKPVISGSICGVLDGGR